MIGLPSRFYWCANVHKLAVSFHHVGDRGTENSTNENSTQENSTYENSTQENSTQSKKQKTQHRKLNTTNTTN